MLCRWTVASDDGGPTAALQVEYNYYHMVAGLEQPTIYLHGGAQLHGGLGARDMVAFCRHYTGDDLGHHQILDRLTQLALDCPYRLMYITYDDTQHAILFNVNPAAAATLYPRCCLKGKLFNSPGCKMCARGIAV